MAEFFLQRVYDTYFKCDYLKYPWKNLGINCFFCYNHINLNLEKVISIIKYYFESNLEIRFANWKIRKSCGRTLFST